MVQNNLCVLPTPHYSYCKKLTIFWLESGHMPTRSKRHHHTVKEKKTQGRFGCNYTQDVGKAKLELYSELIAWVSPLTNCSLYQCLRATSSPFPSSVFLCSFWSCTFLQEKVFPTYIFILSCSSMTAAVYRPLLLLSLPPGVEHSIPSPSQAEHCLS